MVLQTLIAYAVYELVNSNIGTSFQKIKALGNLNIIK